MPEIQRQVPAATGVERRSLVASALCMGSCGLFGIYLGGLLGPTVAAAGGAAGLMVIARSSRAAARRSAERLQAFVDEVFEQIEVHRQEETRLRAVARSMAAENEESERRRRAAETAERTKTAFIKNLGQEVRTPLSNVLGMSGLLLSTELNENQSDYARTIHGAADALLAIVDDVLALSYINAGALEIERREFELTYCVESVVETCANKVKGRMNAPLVECRLDPALPPWVVGDRARLRQALLTVLDRAVERSPEGRVALSAQVSEQDASGMLLRFEVTDSGEPLDAYARERMFEEFPAHEGGTGMLGLAVARQLALLMGGDMGVEDRAARGGGHPGRIGTPSRERGTVVWMTARCGISRREVAGAPHDDRVELAGMKVLLVDSEAESRGALRKAADALGLALDAAATAAEALQLLKDAAAGGKTYAVGLIDADLSDIGGRDFGELLQSVPEAAGMGLILLRPVGAFDRPTDLARHGFDAWVSKPVSEARLRTALLHVTAEPTEEKGDRAAPAEPRAQPKQLGARVLLVEDNIVNQKVARLLLSQIGCKVEVALSGMEAIEKAMALEVDLILMDCLMPELDGYDATRAIRMLSDPLKSRVPIVGMTTGSRPSNRDTCIAAGMDDHVTKPVRLEELMRVVRHWSARPSQSFTEKHMYDEDERSLDPGVIASLRDLGGDDPSIFNELVELFLEDTPVRIHALEQALTSGSAHDLESAAHALKSSSGNLGAYVLSTLCKEIEVLGRNKNLESAASLVARSREEFQRVEEALREELG